MNSSENDSLPRRLSRAANALCKLLQAHDRKIVFAESCTGGKMAAAMTAVPGVSSCFCGSAVTYREDAKIRWLSVDPVDLKKHSAESTLVTESMAAGVIRVTPESDCAIAITGHLGPDVDAEIDGIIYVAFQQTNESSPSAACRQFRLQAVTRKDRQTEAACLAFEFAIAELSPTSANHSPE